ncbi:efflux RND transporter permease subunit [Ferrimonas balearica]|uniref:efflux RND transporter permease subunit n=1 Tax=Ferrimonas balearica TaxID=44012 RepID=UPI001C953722|nr:efflux RND transporter permease subunit [Ferrimonas balearica]MBY6019614.1 efflux RND transporter permease subunit [Halomonas denitrificans]MBY6096680.1 efflux RND transporter permease subunit [Ferrimonas balearica]MBY6108507.1 efflux RND transporter permease subunit [Ferrimonas balearica]
MFTDIFIRRPVLAVVLNVLLLVFGVRALMDLQVREYPDMEIGQINVTTTYPGANAELVQGFVTTPIQEAIASTEGIDYIKATSRASFSQLEVYLQLGYDANTAMAEMLTKLNEVKGRLPTDIDEPIIAKETAGGGAIMYLAYTSENMSGVQVTDYLRRVVQPKLTEADGVAEAEIIGEQQFAMRIWLDPVRMRANGVSADDINRALASNNFQSAAGEIRDSLTVTPVRASTSLQDVESFRNITVKTDGQQVVKLQDVARVELASKSDKVIVVYTGKPAVYIGIMTTPDANPLDVAKDVREILPKIARDLPPGMEQHLSHDSTEYIEESINEVVVTLAEAVVIVILVVFLFLGSLRSVLIPIVTVPLSLVGVCLFMMGMGFSLNLLTLLAMVMAISLVVDDAIVVVENVHRHLEEGLSPVRAAVIGAREIAMPVIAMTITLAAVYAPIGFMGGLTGSLFSEFAFTLAGAVLISGFIALTLSPMMCAKLLNKQALEGKFVHWLDVNFGRLKDGYHNLLEHIVRDYKGPILGAAVLLLFAIGAMFMLTRSELAPTEDRGFIFNIATGPDNANVNYSFEYAKQFQKMAESLPEYEQTFMFAGYPTENQFMSGMVLKPWSERERTQMEVQPILQNMVKSIPGMDVFSVNPPALPGTAMGLPVEFVITSTMDHAQLYEVAEQLKEEALKSGMFMVVNNTLKLNKPQVHVMIDREKAGQLGISMQSIGAVLAAQLGDFRTNYFDMQGRSYEVIPQADGPFRMTPESIADLYVLTSAGQQIPLSTVVKVSEEVIPNALTQFQQLNSATIEAMPMPGSATIGDAHQFLSSKLLEIAPSGYAYDFGGQSRQYEQEGSALYVTFALALVVIFLVLAAQFESWRDPVVVLVTVPLSIFGAMIPLFLGVATLNIYTQVGLITLVGLISKHGILIVEFANQLQRTGKDKAAAVIEAAALRLRPILMTTAAMVLGVMPLVLADGAGAVSRFNIGLVITVGLSIGTFFTLFVVPVMYALFAKTIDNDAEAALAKETTE